MTICSMFPELTKELAGNSLSSGVRSPLLCFHFGTVHHGDPFQSAGSHFPSAGKAFRVKDACDATVTAGPLPSRWNTPLPVIGV